jgi:hypothetical protein
MVSDPEQSMCLSLFCGVVPISILRPTTIWSSAGHHFVDVVGGHFLGAAGSRPLQLGRHSSSRVVSEGKGGAFTSWREKITALLGIPFLYTPRPIFQICSINKVKTYHHKRESGCNFSIGKLLEPQVLWDKKGIPRCDFQGPWAL